MVYNHYIQVLRNLGLKWIIITLILQETEQFLILTLYLLVCRYKSHLTVNRPVVRVVKFNCMKTLFMAILTKKQH